MITIEQIEKAFDTLPENLRKAMYSIDSDAILVSLAQKYTVHVDDIGKIQAQILYVTLGLSRPEDFGKDLLDANIVLPKETLNLLIKDINEQIFRPTREKLKELDERDLLRASRDEEESTPIQATPEISTTNPAPIENQTPKNDMVVNKLTTPFTLAPEKTNTSISDLKKEGDRKIIDPYREKPL